MNDKDPKGYYEVLGVTVSASQALIRTAFRTRAMELHPDRNSSKDATQQFQLLNEAYAVLGDPQSRARYDTATVEATNSKSTESEEAPEYVVCSVCRKITAQLRYVIFYEVKSFIFSTTRTPVQGVFCSACAEKKSLRATATTWILGWWGFPWGLIYTPHALFVNLIGGARPDDVNARLAARQAWVFAFFGKIDVARAVALDAFDLAKKIKSTISLDEQRRRGFGYDANSEVNQLRQAIGKLVESLGANVSGSRLINSWALFRRPFYLQSCIGIVVVALIIYWGSADPQHVPTAPKGHVPSQPKPHSAPMQPRTNNLESAPDWLVAKPAVTPRVADRGAPAPNKDKYVRSALAPNGLPWPISAGYLNGFERLHADGLSTVTVDNSRNESDAFVKLFSMSGDRSYPVRAFFLPGHGKFTLENVRAGSYDIRYRDLDSGVLSRSESFSLEQFRESDGTKFSVLTLTLYKVANGNMQTFGISEDEF